MSLVKVLVLLAGAIFNNNLSYTGSSVECLSKNVYYEARDQGMEGKVAVLFVTLNRVKSVYFPNDFCDVIWQKGQFEWTEDGKSDNPKEVEKYKEIVLLAIDFLSNIEKYEDPTNGALFYHANYVKPCWLPDATLVSTVKDHLFYDVDHNGVSCWRR